MPSSVRPLLSCTTPLRCTTSAEAPTKSAETRTTSAPIPKKRVGQAGAAHAFNCTEKSNQAPLSAVVCVESAIFILLHVVGSRPNTEKDRAKPSNGLRKKLSYSLHQPDHFTTDLLALGDKYVSCSVPSLNWSMWEATRKSAREQMDMTSLRSTPSLRQNPRSG